MRQIIVTESDRSSLEALLASGFAQAAGPSADFDDLSAELNRAQTVSPDEVPNGVVTMNSTVVLSDLETGEKETYTLVFPTDADIAEGRLSVLAPIGIAILGQHVGDVLKWRVPAGMRRLKIEEIVYQPERAKALSTG